MISAPGKLADAPIKSEKTLDMCSFLLIQNIWCDQVKRLNFHVGGYKTGLIFIFIGNTKEGKNISDRLFKIKDLCY